MEAPLTELGPRPRNQHFTAFSRTEVCPPRHVSDRNIDVPEVDWASAADAVKSSYSHLVKGPLVHWQPVKHITTRTFSCSMLTVDEDSVLSFDADEFCTT